MELNEEQKRASESIYGQVLVVSCPGSGKTTVIIQRIKNMILMGINPTQMLNITFTKAAADEMEERFASKHGKCGVSFGTIHSFCYRVLCKEFNYTKDNILKESEKWLFFANRLQKVIPPNEMEDTTKKIIGEISYVKNRELDYRTYIPESCDSALFVPLFKEYEDFKKALQKIDFDDMLIVCRNTFKAQPDVLKRWQETYKFITVDEYQDTNAIQAEVFYMLAGDNGNLFVVGDDDQSIYGFRSADSSIMLGFPKRFPRCKTIYMASNYRSGKNIVTVAGKLIKNNSKRFIKEFNATREIKGEVFLIKNANSSTQAETIRKNIEALHNAGEEFKDIAILYRTNSENMEPVSELIKYKIPFYTTEKPHSIHEEFIYEDILAYYRLSHDQEKRGDVQKILNHPSRYLKTEYFKNLSLNRRSLLEAARKTPNSDSSMNGIFDLFSELKQLSNLDEPRTFIEFLSESIGYKKWLIDFAKYRGKEPKDYLHILDALKKEASDYDNMEDWSAYVLHYEAELEKKKKDKSKDGVCLSTFHSAKGLEWKKVFVIDVNEDTVPYCKAESPEELEEERRMFYVAITRAKDSLYLSYLTGNKNDLLPSSYLDEMGIGEKSLDNLSGDASKKLSKNGLAS